MNWRRLTFATSTLAALWPGMAFAAGTPGARESKGRTPAGLVATERGSAANPTDELRRSHEALQAVLSEQLPDWSPEADLVTQRANAILGSIIDYRRMAAVSMGPDWDKLNEDDRTALVRKLGELTNRRFVSTFRRWDARLRFDSQTLDGDLASVMVSVIGRRPVPETRERLEYRLARSGGRWLVYDVVADGGSLTDRYHQLFARAMRRGGFREVLARLDRRLAEPDDAWTEQASASSQTP